MNIHQTELKGVLYCWPDDTPPVSLLKEGVEEVEKAGETLKDKQIDCIYSSDILRTRQTSEIVAKIIGYNLEDIVYDQRLRDINWGIFEGKTEEEGWEFYNNNYLKRFEIAPPEGESRSECQKRMSEVVKSIENSNQNKNILIVSHADPLWLLEGYMKGMDNPTLLNKKEEMLMQPGEVKEIYE